MKTVKEVSRITGVRVRTLHHYDAIGLLKPTQVTEAGYRLYDDRALGRLQSILLFRELQFSLKEIGEILDRPNFDPSQALKEQIHLLELQHKRLGELISFARDIQRKGIYPMQFDVFDRSELEAYKEEAKTRWGKTAAYQEYQARDERGEDLKGPTDRLMGLFVRLGSMRGLAPDDEAVQKQIEALQNLITDHYYTCTHEILADLGRMYVEDTRMKNAIDQAGGEGTAELAKQAILVYCSR